MVEDQSSSQRLKDQEVTSARRASARDLRTEAMTVIVIVVTMTARETLTEASGMVSQFLPPLMNQSSLVCRAWTMSLKPMKPRMTASP